MSSEPLEASCTEVVYNSRTAGTSVITEAPSEEKVVEAVVPSGNVAVTSPSPEALPTARPIDAAPVSSVRAVAVSFEKVAIFSSDNVKSIRVSVRGLSN